MAQDIPPEQAEAIIREIEQSQIDDNVPPRAEFHRLLMRDLSAFFSTEKDPKPDIDYELLRDGPTQTGTSYPKFYAWVRIRGSRDRQGAARLAAIEGLRFEVTHFVERDAIVTNPSQLDALFPGPVAAVIAARVSAGGQ